ncbi:MliC family protein [Entomobacter blattae]|uniref:Membrane-bound lysozyme-inhibitor of c-type lysozyme n=1 Tax=Entomobacter blattae TaxID=2762277 RepID=A0A7H1NPE7_9PROT|nr:MliC family protein [Entomobacter blattae]QNT77657.1 Membrane-bound lysozyme-inhibitor of c-type lysozyme [Entomobacter blattae]
MMELAKNFLGIFTMASILGMAMGAAQASEVKFDIPGQNKVETTAARYICKKSSLPLPVKIFRVSYINAGPTSIAIVPVKDGATVFSNVVAASGARYVAGQFEWWVNKDGATFTDVNNKNATASCTEVKNPKAKENSQ